MSETILQDEKEKTAEPNETFIDSTEEKEFKRAIELTLYDHHSQGRLKEFKQFLMNRLEKLKDALVAIDQVVEERSDNHDTTDSIEEEMNKTASSQKVPAGMEVLEQGVRPRDIYLIERGLVKLVRRETEGKDAIAAIRYPGWFLAVSAVLLDQQYPVSAVTVTPCRLRRIRADKFRALIREDVQTAWKLSLMMAREVHYHLMQVTGIECLSGRQRLEELLWQLISTMEQGSTNRSVRVQFPAKYSEIAQILAVTPQYLSWLLGQMEKDRIIQRDKGSVVVFQPEKLWHREELSESSYSFGNIY